MRIQSANIQSTGWLLGGAPVVAAVLFAHALGRKHNFTVDGVVLIHHGRQLLGEEVNKVFHPQQRRAAAYTFTNDPKRDYSSKNQQALSLQPTATGHLDITLVLSITGSCSVEDVSETISTMKFAGGSITSVGKISTEDPSEMSLTDICYEVRQKHGGGFVVTERKDLLVVKAGASEGLVGQMRDALGTPKEGNTWIAPACLGYAFLSEATSRPGAREGYAHAVAEPLVGMIQYVSLRSPALEKQPFFLWSARWVRSDVFVVTQAVDDASL